jgi:N utilization substance protein B|tara:strand:+ start:384 stop:839 length:456 start_codon:yes stop_codon:yes gene_type:complete
MGSPVVNDLHEIRRGALLAICQFDAGRDDEPDTVRDGLLAGGVPERLLEPATELANDAWTGRTESDAVIATLAADWPIHRQPCVDRGLLRLAAWEMRSGRVPTAVAIDEAIELAREFSTEDSPAFVNGVLDAYRQHLEASTPDPAAAEHAD